MKPSRVEYELGQDRYGRRTRLIIHREPGLDHFEIKSDPVSQRDEGECIRSLTIEQLRAIGEALS